MDSSPSMQLLPEGKGKEKAKEADRVKPDVAVDNSRSLVERAIDKCFIHRVHSALRDGSDKHYEPVLVSIGPYYYLNTPTLCEMEKHKVHYWQVLLDRVKEKSSARYIEALKNERGEPQASDCYVHDIPMHPDHNFGEYMVVDGCFMIELFRRNKNPGEYAQDKRKDMLMKMRWMKPCLARDMLLFENQIPLFVLRTLFTLTEQMPNEHDLVQLALGFFQFNGKPIPNLNPTTSLDGIPHLLGLVYEALVPETPKLSKRIPWESREFIKSAVALEQSGVKFLKAADSKVFYDILFYYYELSIPPLAIDENTECFFRNLVAYEQYSEDYSRHRVTDYLRVMACLIKSPEDVKLLCRCGIIDNRFVDDVKISTMFTLLCSGVHFDPENFIYAHLFDDVNSYCNRRWNENRAVLLREYFKSPWTVLQVYATVMTILLAALQVMLAFFPPKKT